MYVGMMTLINGLNVLISGGAVISGFPDALLLLGNGSLFGVPMPLILFVCERKGGDAESGMSCCKRYVYRPAKQHYSERKTPRREPT